MSEAPERIRIDPDHHGWNTQVVGWSEEFFMGEVNGWPEYIRADIAEAALTAAQERGARLREALQNLIDAYPYEDMGHVAVLHDDARAVLQGETTPASAGKE
jgi:hypothetical protein